MTSAVVIARPNALLRRAGWGLLVLPAALAGLAGRSGLQRRIAAAVAAAPPAGRAPGGWPPGEWRPAARTAGRGLLAAPSGLMLWWLAFMATVNTIRCVFVYPLVAGPDYTGAWGGPGWLGAWAVHASMAIVLLPLELWLLSALTLLSAWIFAGDGPRRVRPVAALAGVGIVVFLVAWVRQI